MRSEAGFSLIEMLVSFAILVLVFLGVASFIVQNSQANTAEQMAVTIQSDARSSLSIIENVLRSGGWDPRNVGIAAVALDPSPTGTDQYIEAFADLNEDGDTLDFGEDVTVRHHNSCLEWRRTYDTSQPFETLACDITNDQDGDGTIEQFFTPDSTTSPTRITIKITAQSPAKDPRSGLYLRSTVSSDVVLRTSL
jgi:Tfp pilus assembly protein PilW